MNQQHDKIILPPDYLSMSAPDLVKLSLRMQARIRQIDDQIKDAARNNPTMAPGRFGSADWHSRARRAQDYYRRDIDRVHEQLHNLAATEQNNVSARQAATTERNNVSARQATTTERNNVSTRQATVITREAKINAAFRRLARQRLTETLYEGILKEAKEEAILAVQAEAQEAGQ